MFQAYMPCKKEQAVSEVAIEQLAGEGRYAKKSCTTKDTIKRLAEFASGVRSLDAFVKWFNFFRSRTLHLNTNSESSADQFQYVCQG